MRALRFPRVLTLILCVALASVSCEEIFGGPDDPYNPGGTPSTPSNNNKPTYTITVSPSGTINFPASGGTVYLGVTTNAETFGATFPKRDWLKLAYSKDKTGIDATISANDSGSNREFEITVYALNKGSDEHLAEVVLKCVQPAMGGSSSQNIEYGGEEYSTSIRFDFGNSSISAQGCEVLTMTGTYPADASSASVSLIGNKDLPQIAMLCNSGGDILMLSRDLCPNGTQVTIDARSSALAYVTLHPLFGPVIGKEDFGLLKDMILNASSFSAFEKQVDAAIKAERPLFDESNTSLRNAFDNLMVELCSNIDNPETRTTNMESISGEGYLNINVEGKVVSISPCGLTPYYSGKIMDADDNVVAYMDIPAGEDYGVSDLLFRWGNFKYGKPVSFDFNGFRKEYEGEYYFHFDRNTATAQADNFCSLLCNFLDIVGAGLSAKEFKSQFIGDIAYYANKNIAAFSAFADGKVDNLEVAEFGWGFLVDFMNSEKFASWFKKEATKASAKAVAKKINLISAIYCGIRGSANALTRIGFRLNAPNEVNFCLCNVGSFPLYPCSYVTLVLVSGDQQEGVTGELLDKPIKVRVHTGNNDNAAERFLVNFTVYQGEGSVSDEYVETDRNLEAQTWWRLGPGGPYQVLRAEVLDYASHGVISEFPLYIEATNTDAGQFNKTPIPEKLRGLWKMNSEQVDMERVTIALGENKASFYDPIFPGRDFKDIPVWAEEISNKEYNIYFYDQDGSGEYPMFMNHVTIVNSKTIIIDNLYNFYEGREFIVQGSLSQPFKQVSLLCEFDNSAGQHAQVNCYAYQGSNLTVTPYGTDYHVVIDKSAGDKVEKLSFDIKRVASVAGYDYRVRDLEYLYDEWWIYDSSTNPVTWEHKYESLKLDDVPLIFNVSGTAWWTANAYTAINYMSTSEVSPEDNMYYTKEGHVAIGDNVFRIQVVF